MGTLDDWTLTAYAELGLDRLSEQHRQLILELARDAAHGVVRPAAPITTYLLGIAVGRGADPAEAAARLAALAQDWTPRAGSATDLAGGSAGQALGSVE